MSLSLGLPAEALGSLSKPNVIFDNVWRSTELRLFRYVNDEPKIVSNLHSDLGLLSLVFGDVPGLEVWHEKNRTLIEIEKMYKTPTATITMGRELTFLSNGQYPAGGHLVRSYGRDHVSPGASPPYRHSIVFVMRAHWPVAIDLDQMTTNITGPFQPLVVTDDDGKTVQLRKFTAGDLFATFRAATRNVNSRALERERDNQRILKRREAVGTNTRKEKSL